jgi:hypothetical protein
MAKILMLWAEERVAQVVECLPTKGKALSSNPRTSQKNKEK